LCFEDGTISPICILLSIGSLGKARFSSHAPYRKELLEGRFWSAIAVRVDDSLALSRRARSIALDDDKQKSFLICMGANSTKPYQKTKDMEKFVKKQRSARIHQKLKIRRTMLQDE
jgi:hypothetical protein